MRFNKLFTAALAVTSLIAVPVTTFAARPQVPRGACTATVVNPLSEQDVVAPLSEEEIATLLWMREEEKLARDMYITLNLYWPTDVFTNIAASEQRHFDAIGRKLELYGLADPATEVVGDFTNPALQALYDELLAQGMVSEVGALTVGATIEEVDMIDIQAAIDGTTSVPLQRTYQHLLAGSMNHLRSFVQVLEGLGVVYVPQYLDQETYDEIIGK